MTTRVSLGVGGAEAVGGGSGSAILSGDGRYLAFSSNATNLVAGDGNAAQDVFVRDLETSTTRRVSVGSEGVQSNGGSLSPAFSSDGRHVAFFSLATNLVANDTNAQTDVFLHDARLFQRRRVSVTSEGTQAVGGNSFNPALSSDGRYVTFQADATNLVAGDTNGATDVFVHDRGTGATTRVSVGAAGAQATGASRNPDVSSDGRYIAFDSQATSLVDGDTNTATDVFVHDRATGTTTRVSIATGGAQGNGASEIPSISANGRYVAFQSVATSLVAGDTNNRSDVFVHDRATGATTRVSVGNSGIQADNSSSSPALSGDGRHVAFSSAAINLVTGDTNGAIDVFVHDRLTGTIARVSIGSGGTQAAGGASSFPRLSADGRYVAFQSTATNLVTADTNGVLDVFVHDCETGATTRVSVASDGAQALDGSGLGSFQPDLNADGRYVVFSSFAANLVVGDTNSASDVFVHDRLTGVTSRASRAIDSGQPTGDSSQGAAISADGHVIAYHSGAVNLVPDDTNNRLNIFVRALTPVLDGITPRSGPISGRDDGGDRGRRLRPRHDGAARKHHSRSHRQLVFDSRVRHHRCAPLRADKPHAHGAGLRSRTALVRLHVCATRCSRHRHRR